MIICCNRYSKFGCLAEGIQNEEEKNAPEWWLWRNKAKTKIYIRMKWSMNRHTSLLIISIHSFNSNCIFFLQLFGARPISMIFGTTDTSTTTTKNKNTEKTKYFILNALSDWLIMWNNNSNDKIPETSLPMHVKCEMWTLSFSFLVWTSAKNWMKIAWNLLLQWCFNILCVHIKCNNVTQYAIQRFCRIQNHDEWIESNGTEEERTEEE